jgi:hypothetical protein
MFNFTTRIGWVQDPLQLYQKHYRLIANCRRPHCEHKRDLPVALLTRLFPLETCSAKSPCCCGVAAVACGVLGFALSTSAPSA